MAQSPKKILAGLVVTLLLCVCATAVYSQGNSIDREITAAPGREMRVGVYSSIRPDCTAGPLPAIRLAVAPEHGTVTVRRAMLKATNVKQCLAVEVPAFVGVLSRQPRSQERRSFRIGSELCYRPQTAAAFSCQHFESSK